jgi:hypothetical protein
VGISRPSRRTWWLLLTLKYKDNRFAKNIKTFETIMKHPHSQCIISSIIVF